MTLKLYNTLTRDKDPKGFQPIDPKNVRMYVCGPTVYDFAHIGNARPVIVFDVLYRLLRHIYGANHVTYVRNITDVEDKINARALRDFPGLPLNEAIRNVTEKTANQFHADVKALGCLPPTHEPRATDNIAQMIAIIAALVSKGHAYVAAGEVLFDTQSMPDYGKLSQRKLDEQQAGARVEVEAHKKSPGDFVLWKLSSPEEPGWPSPWGRGRPGWHIECSAMSDRYLWQEAQSRLSAEALARPHQFDIHGGGLDLIFPHHENEIAQSRCAHGTPVMANVWMHNGFLQVEGEKMSKSLGNFVTINELLGQFHGCVLRLNMLRTHYRQPIDWQLRELERSRHELWKWSHLLGDLAVEDEYAGRCPNAIDSKIIGAISDDLNLPGALARLHELSESVMSSRDAARSFAASAQFLGLEGLQNSKNFTDGFVSFVPDDRFDDYKQAHPYLVTFKNYSANSQPEAAHSFGKKAEALGVFPVFVDGELRISFSGNAATETDEANIKSLVDARLAARKAKDFKESDRIRDELAKMGIALKDSKDPKTGDIVTTWEVAR